MLKYRHYLDKAHESRRESPQVLNLRAIHAFLKTRDAEEAKSLLKKSRTQDNATWHFNMALLLAYGGDLKGAIRQYRQAIIFQSDAGTLTQIEDFICWILEIEPEKYQLHYCLGFFNWKAKGDKVQAINDLNDFLNSGTESHFASEKELTKKFIASIKKEIDEQTT